MRKDWITASEHENYRVTVDSSADFQLKRERYEQILGEINMATTEWQETKSDVDYMPWYPPRPYWVSWRRKKRKLLANGSMQVGQK